MLACSVHMAEGRVWRLRTENEYSVVPIEARNRVALRPQTQKYELYKNVKNHETNKKQ